MGQKEEESSFHLLSQGAAKSSWALPDLPLSEWKCLGGFAFPPSAPSPTKGPWGKLGERGGSASLLPPLHSAVLPQVCRNVEGSQLKLSAWAGNSKDGESRQGISCQNLKQNISPESLAAPVEIRPWLSAVLCECVYCVRVYIYPPTEWDSAYPQESTTYMDKGRRKEILFPVFQMGHWILCRYCDCVNEVIARTRSAVGSGSALFVVNIFEDLELGILKYTQSC